ncbi:hypothetical protein RHMOL_Rhmol03G0137300 [Rhododendron molle]|uniref:Uncharacterized protein n=1 Tax=Rhododendron molle TaxID=49168 RepID=A0ACC0PGG6_RHOML|nr:hypothetical protein RHMOL_Rhmol03G0137300 [Rhododendron molle]
MFRSSMVGKLSRCQDSFEYDNLQAYICSSSLRKAALGAVAKNSTEARKDSRVLDYADMELGLSPSIPVHVVLRDWIRQADNKLSFLGFVRLLHGVSSRSFQKA